MKESVHDASKRRPGLPILLPHILHEADACVGQLLVELRGQAGVDVRRDGLFCLSCGVWRD